MLLIYVAMLMIFTGNTFGLAGTQFAAPGSEASKTYEFYGRGVGQLGITFVNIYLFALFAYCMLALRPRTLPAAAPKDPVFRYLAFLAVYFILYSLYGLLAGIEPDNIVHTYGAINLLNMFMMYMIVKRSVIEADDVRRLESVVIVVAALMSLYGLARLPLGGDPVNVYFNHEGTAVSITFFDIGQAAISCVALMCIVLRQTSFLRMGLRNNFLSAIYLANIVLSFRRTSWGGLVIVFLWLILSMDSKRRFPLLILGGIALAGIAGVQAYRFNGTTGGTMTSDITGSHGSVSVTEGRFSELYAAVAAVSQSPAFGLGTWGLNKDFAFQHELELTSFVHSSFVHVYLKMGLVGLIPYVLMVVGFPIWWYRQRKRPWSDTRLRSIADGFFCGFLFWLPDLMFGTPLIIFRHCQMLGLFLAVPVACARINAILLARDAKAVVGDAKPDGKGRAKPGIGKKLPAGGLPAR
jgi:hypothetical protein